MPCSKQGWSSRSDPTPHLSHLVLGPTFSWAVNISKDGVFTAPVPMSDHSLCDSHQQLRSFLVVVFLHPHPRLNTLGPEVKTQTCQFWRKQCIVETFKPFLHLLVSFITFAARDQFPPFSLPPWRMAQIISQSYGPHTLCCNKDQETPGTQLHFWTADALVELLPHGYRKKASTGLSCIRANLDLVAAAE